MIYVFYTQGSSEICSEQSAHIKYISAAQIHYYDIAKDACNGYDCFVFTSKNAILALAHSGALRTDARAICVGASTAKCAQKLGFSDICVPSRAYGAELFSEFGEFLRSHRALFVRARLIASRPVHVDELVAYDSQPLDLPDICFKDADVVVFSSPMMVRYFAARYTLPKRVRIVSIGTSTASIALELLRRRSYIPRETTLGGCARLALRLSFGAIYAKRHKGKKPKGQK